MILRKAILQEHSKTHCTSIVNWIGNDPLRFDELVALFLNGTALERQRAGWPLSYAAIAHPERVRKHLGRLIQNLEKPGLHDAEKRNTVRLLQEIAIPPTHQGRLMNACFRFIADPAEKPAVKAFSITILHNLSKQYPDIKQELRMVVNDQWEHATAAFRARAKKLLREPA